jgi:hypothetical protein
VVCLICSSRGKGGDVKVFIYGKNEMQDSRGFRHTFLGTEFSKVTQVSDFLAYVDCERLIFNGDTIDGVHYLNSGDWVETLSALIEDIEGNWKIVYYKDLFPQEV